MLGYRAPSKKAIADALNGIGDPTLLHFRVRVQETSFFKPEARVPGENPVIGPDAYKDRRWDATLTVDEQGMVTAIR